MTAISEDPVGQIISVDEASGLALVEVQAEAVCARCASGKGCGAGLLGGGAKSRRLAAHVPAAMSLRRGDTVQISLAPGNLLQAAALVYGVPLLGALLGALSAYQLQLNDLNAAICALLGLCVGVAAARVASVKHRCAAAFTPSIRAYLGSIAEGESGNRELGDV